MAPDTEPAAEPSALPSADWRQQPIGDLGGFINYLRCPGNADDNAAISHFFSELGTHEQMLERILADPATATLVEQRYQPPGVTLEDLEGLPIGTLGRTYADFIDSHHFNPHFFHREGVDDAMAYVINRLRDTHDIWHVVLGFDASEAGESGMNAFTFTQTGNPSTCLLMAAKLIRSIPQAAGDREHVIQQIVRGFSLGMEAPPFLAEPWEEHWRTPLEELRRRFSLPD
jgi:ubiquinone biosynthesis protein Coq4